MTVAEFLEKMDTIAQWRDRLFWWKSQAVVGGSLTAIFVLQAAIYFASGRPGLGVMYAVASALEAIVLARAITSIHYVKQVIYKLKRLAGVTNEL